MKKTTVFIFAFLFTAIFNYSSGKSNGDPSETDKPDSITTLVINANLTVVLVNNDKATLQVEGDKFLKKFVTFKKTGDTLVIGSNRNRDFKGSGVIYIPASLIRRIRINSDADVRSLFALKIPKLDVVINGVCTVAISNIGELNVTKTEDYVFEQNTKVRYYPSGVL